MTLYHSKEDLLIRVWEYIKRGIAMHLGASFLISTTFFYASQEPAI